LSSPEAQLRTFSDHIIELHKVARTPDRVAAFRFKRTVVAIIAI
jgi:hypothetical protein